MATLASALGSVGDPFSGALVVGGVFVGYELRTEHPMLDVRLFRNFRLSSGTGAIAAASLALAGLVFLLTQYLQTVRGYTPFEAGVRVIPLAIGFAVGARASSRLIAKLGTKKVVTVGLLVVAAMLMSLSFVGSGSAYWLLGAGLFLFGIGLGATTVASTDAVVAAVPEANAGIGSALNDSARQVGYALGVATLGSVFNSVYSSNMETDVAGLPADAAEVAKNSVGGAEQIAASLGGLAGDALREAASAAFMDAFGAAAIVGAAIAFIGSLLVLRFMPARDQVVGARIEQQAEAGSG